MFGYTIIKKSDVKDLHDRIDELKRAGWASVCAWYKAMGMLSYEQNEEMKRHYNWFRESAVFSHDKPIDGARPMKPNFCKYIAAGATTPAPLSVEDGGKE